MRHRISGLDVKLGVRMLVKHPGLTLASVLGIAVAIAISVVSFVFTTDVVDPALPLEEGDRMVGIKLWDAEASRQELRVLSDFAVWRSELRTVEGLSAFRSTSRNLITSGGLVGPVQVAEMTASGFRTARVAPVLGRYYSDADEERGAAPVAVIGYGVWQGHFAGDRSVLGRTIRLGETPHTVIGVMPEGFAFPVNHDVWTPLQVRLPAYAPLEGPAVYVFGRLVPGATLERAQAELTAVGRRAASTFATTHARLHPRLVPYPAAVGFDLAEDALRIYLMQVMLSSLLMVICVNVAILIYARTATRLGEIAVRSALGATRLRIVVQLLVEALVLSTVGALIGLTAAILVMRHLSALLVEWRGPYWVDLSLTVEAVAYILGLTLFAAAVIGGLPALFATGRRIRATLSQLSGGTGVKIGRTWTVLIVAQVAVSVAIVPAMLAYASRSIQHLTTTPGFATSEYLTARLEVDWEEADGAPAGAARAQFASRLSNRLSELIGRMEAEPGVTGVTAASDLPGVEATARIEVDGVQGPAGSYSGHRIKTLSVDEDFFEVFGVPVLAGRSFRSSDMDDVGNPVVVNESFVREVLGAKNALGQRFRYLPSGEERDSSDLARRFEVVGVVGDLPPNRTDPEGTLAKVYHPLAPGKTYPLSVALHLRPDAAQSVAQRLREVALALDPSLQLYEVVTLEEYYRNGEQRLVKLEALAIALTVLSVLLITAAGIYAMMSFTVTKRWREIGIRSALGASRRRILGGIFSRAVIQLASGGVVGLGAALAFDRLSAGEFLGAYPATFLALGFATILGVGVLAALGPARRALTAEPMQAIREE